MRQHIARQHRRRPQGSVKFGMVLSFGPQARWRDAVAAEGVGFAIGGNVDEEGHKTAAIKPAAIAT